MKTAPIDTESGLSSGRVAAYVTTTCAVVAVFGLAWFLREVLLLGFGAVLTAIIIRAIGSPLVTRFHFREGRAVLVVVLSVAITLAALSWLFGWQLTNQLSGIGERLPAAVKELREHIEAAPIGKKALEKISIQSSEAGSGNWMQSIGKVLTISATTLGHFFLVLVAGIFLAANPTLYVDGALRLVPPRHRRTVGGALDYTGKALHRWILGQMVSMTAIGTLTGLGLWAVGAPLPLALGTIAGLLAFIPIIGAVVAFVPGVLVAFTDSPQTALYAAIVFIVVQQLEGHLITPLAQKWAVKLPPVYGILAILSFAMLFGFLGVLFGCPLAVAVMCLVEKLYVEKGLEDGESPA